jgi:hypothetical protein
VKIDDLIDRSRGHGFKYADARRAALRRRVVVRIEFTTIARIDALRPAFDQASRASLIRAFCLAGLAMAEEHVKASPTPEGEAAP